MKSFSRKVYILGLLFVLAVGLNTFEGFRQLETSLRYEAERGIEYKLEYILSQITADLSQVEGTLDATEILLTVGEDEDHLLGFFIEVLRQNPSYLSIYLGTPDNRMINGSGWIPPEGFDVRVRPWYQRAVREDKLVFTEPYLNASDDNWVITVAKPVYSRDGKHLGVIAIDKTLQGMLEFLETETASENGFSFFLDHGGDIIVDRSGALEPDNVVQLSSDLVSRLLSEPSGHVFTNIEGADGYLRWQALEGSGFVIGTFAPLSDFFDRRAQSLQLIASAVVALLVVFSMLFFFQNRYIVRPVRILEQDILGISLDEDPAYRLPVSKRHPFEALRRTINVVLDQTQEHYENVVYQQEELSAAYAQLVAHEQQLQAQHTEIKQHEAKAQFLADHDPLTGLFNRRKFEEDLSSSLQAGQMGAVLMFDIDDFKNINDTQGHVYGDRVLRSIALLLKKQLQPNETAYRFGGDEFLIIIEGEVDPEEIRATIEEVSRCLNETSVINKRHSRITSSIGIVRYPFDGTTVEELLIKVDIAMYNAKKGGKNRYMFFESGMATTFSERVQVERMLIEAIQTESFRLLYQPVVNADTGDITYLEALIRIKDNPLSPAVFIAVAEESNLILPIGRWVIKEAVSQLIKWEEAGMDLKPVSINLSAQQFYDDGLVDFLVEQIELSGVDPGLIEMEITETVLIGNAQEAIEIIERIRALGIKMALDDFGTGYSSINYITRIPVDRIKLDRSMTEKLIENIPVMEGLIAIAHGLNMDVVAEGVEQVEEANLLIEVGCDYLQGYLFSPPIPPEDAEQIMHTDFGDILGLRDG